jgi:predicted CXXCH cytochrome family protein
VHGFAKGTHPSFKATLLVQGAREDNTEWSSVRTAVLGAHEQSNLKFSHKQHLSGTAMKQLGCRDCHVLAANGEHFAPTTMAKACSSCHSLTFDEEHTERQLPHGNALAASAMLEDYFIRNAVAPVAPQFVRRPLPDRPQRAVEKCNDAPLVCGRRNAEAAVIGFFTDRGCVECHVVNDSKNPEITQRFTVRPVRLVADYFTDMRFDHRAHEVMKDKTGDDACAQCHGARQSEQSSDLLIPDVNVCLTCHEDRRVENKVLTGCVSCHVYHPTEAVRKTNMAGESSSP